jgi:hypothetical protein
MDRPFEHSFRNQVQPVLARFGCSSGACHGAAAGKAGFKLSLRGYDDEGDWLTLTRHAQGRRIHLADPGRSLALLKPTGAVPHKGGVRFDPGSREYAVIAEWIAAGAPGPRKDDPRIDRIEIVPPRVVLRPGMEQQIVVRAHFNDGSVFDATPWAKYTYSDSSVAIVDDTGRAKVNGNGEGAITAWYLSKIAIATVSVPYANELPPETFTQADRRNFIDDQVLEKLRSLNLPPSPRCTDGEFIRRASIDTIGVLPTAGETRAFLADPAADKRDRLVDALLARPEYVDYWTYRWSDLFLVTSRRLPAPAMWAYHTWIRNQVAANVPWDQVARKVVTATGGTIENGAACFYLLHDEPANMAEVVSQTFLGMSIQCAKCHNTRWRSGRTTSTTRSRPSAPRAPRKARHGPATWSSPAPPRPTSSSPSGTAPRPPHRSTGLLPRRATRATAARRSPTGWSRATTRTSPGRSSTASGRISWESGSSRPSTTCERPIRRRTKSSSRRSPTISPSGSSTSRNSCARSSSPRPTSAPATRFRGTRPTAASMRITPPGGRWPRSRSTRPARSRGSRPSPARRPRGPAAFAYPVGWRALQLPDANIDSYFLKSFGRADRNIPCECERASMPSMAQALHIANGDTLNSKLRAKDNRIGALLARKASDERIVEEAYLEALSRMPTAEERSKILAILSDSRENKREALEDLFWGLLSSREFLFNH